MTPQQTLEIQQLDLPPVTALRIPGRSASDPASISSAMGACFPALMAGVGRYGLIPVGPPRAIYETYGPEGTSFQVVIPIRPTDRAVDPPLSVGELAGGPVYRFTHHGSYANLWRTYGAITEYMKSKGLMQSEADWAKFTPMWEEYVNDPATTPEAGMLTYIYLPAK